MEKKENQRVMLTKRLIKEGMVSMLAEKSIHKISVRELCDTAGINRSTFYHYYGNQYDVLNAIENELLEHISDSLGKLKGDSFEQMNVICKFIDRNAELSRLLIYNNIDPEFANKLFSLAPIREQLMKKIMDHFVEDRADYVFSFVSNGGYYLLRDWIGKENRESPDKIAGLILQLAEKVCG